MNEVYNSNGYKITWEQGTGIPGKVMVNGEYIKPGSYYFLFKLWNNDVIEKHYTVNLHHPIVTPDVTDRVINIFKRFMI